MTSFLAVLVIVRAVSWQASDAQAQLYAERLGEQAIRVSASADSTPRAALSGPHVIRWWEGAAVFGGMVAMSTLDQPLQRYIQRHRSSAGDNVAGVARRMGQVEVFGTAAGAMMIMGAAGHRPALRRAALRVALSLALAGTLSSAGKLLAGRPRPDQVGDADDLKLLSGRQSLPSGHTTMAFALATSLANEIHRPWVTVGLLTAASGTGWSRLNDNKHWLSDVLAGAGVGIVSAQLIDGRWTVFHLRPPAVLAAPGGLAFVWRAAF